MISQKNFCCRLAFLFIIILIQSTVYGQIEGQDLIDSLRADSVRQRLKLIVEKKDTTVLVPLDSLSEEIVGNKQSKSKYKPQRAWWYSAILPGAGQVYNGKAWKVPIIYTVFIGTYYMVVDNNFKYQTFKEAYKNYSIDGPPQWQPSYSESQLKDRKDFYRRNRDLSIIVGGLMYLLNIIDASVDANLMNFDISDDLTMSLHPDVEPIMNQQQSTFGLKFVLTLNK